MASIVLDDSTYRLKTGGVEWESLADPSKFGGASTWPNVTDPPKQYGTFNVSFEGTSIAFSGWVGSPHGSQPPTFLVSIDGSRPRESSYQAGSIDVHQWYQSPMLSDKAHTINVTGFPENIEIDYMVVTAGQKTPLLGERLIVDDIDPAITYHGGWNYQDHASYETDSEDGSMLLYPHGNGTHTTTTTGSGATFHFIGTLVSVYGVFNWNAPCNMSVKYTIDDFSTTKNYTVVGTQFYKDRVGSVGHTVLFASDVLPAGQHTLSFDLVTISSDADSNDFSLSFDYIIYSPSVNSLAELGSYQASMTSTVPTSIATTIPPTSIRHSRKVAEIAGGTVGGLVVLGVLLLILFRKRYRSWRLKSSISDGGLAVRDDDILTPAPTHLSVAPFTSLESTSTGIPSALKRPRPPDVIPVFSPSSQANSSVGQTTENGAHVVHPFNSPYSHNPALKEYIANFTSRSTMHDTVPNDHPVTQSPPPGYQA